jgi:hypothetical protein
MSAPTSQSAKQNTNPPSSPDNPATHIDRNSAIALSIILFLILVAIAWYLRLHLAQKRQQDLERQAQADRAGGGGGHVDPEWGRVTWNRQCSSCGEETRRGRMSSLFRLKSVVGRKDSVATSSASASPCSPDTPGIDPAVGEDGDKKKWPWLSRWRTQSTRSSVLGPDASVVYENTLPLTSTERPSRTSTSVRRHSQKSSLDPLPLCNPVYPVRARRRSSSLPKDTYDKRWWNEVARRGSTTSPTRRSSVLDVVIEPGAGSPAGGLWGGERGRTRSAHASWESLCVGHL